MGLSGFLSLQNDVTDEIDLVDFGFSRDDVVAADQVHLTIMGEDDDALRYWYDNNLSLDMNIGHRLLANVEYLIGGQIQLLRMMSESGDPISVAITLLRDSPAPVRTVYGDYDYGY